MTAVGNFRLEVTSVVAVQAICHVASKVATGTIFSSYPTKHTANCSNIGKCQGFGNRSIRNEDFSFFQMLDLQIESKIYPTNFTLQTDYNQNGLLNFNTMATSSGNDDVFFSTNEVNESKFY